jgi:hypothetical protein
MGDVGTAGGAVDDVVVLGGAVVVVVPDVSTELLSP